MYTQGDWKAYKDKLGRDTWMVDVEHTGHEKVYTEIAIVFGEANAQLITAAPAMLVALKRITTLLHGVSTATQAGVGICEDDANLAIAAAENGG